MKEIWEELIAKSNANIKEHTEEFKAKYKDFGFYEWIELNAWINQYIRDVAYPLVECARQNGLNVKINMQSGIIG